MQIRHMNKECANSRIGVGREEAGMKMGTGFSEDSVLEFLLVCLSVFYQFLFINFSCTIL